MKKNVRSQINALANNIIVEGNNIDTRSMKEMLMQLYDKLTQLEFLESQEKNIEGIPERKALDSKTYREENWFQDPKPVPQPQHSDELVEPLMEKIKDIVAQMPHEAVRVDELLEEILPKKENTQNDLEKFASSYQEMPVFERKKEDERKEDPTFPESKTSKIEKPKSLNDKLNKGINIGLNDRLAFIKHLFENKADDYKRVLSQINTMTTFEEVKIFIEENVKPDYNNWKDKEEYAERFVLIVEKRFK